MNYNILYMCFSLLKIKQTDDIARLHQMNPYTDE